MKSVFVGEKAMILDGALRGVWGTVIYANSRTKTVKLSVMNTRDTITTSFDNIEQENADEQAPELLEVVK